MLGSHHVLKLGNKKKNPGLPGGPVVKTSFSNEGDAGSRSMVR